MSRMQLFLNIFFVNRVDVTFAGDVTEILVMDEYDDESVDSDSDDVMNFEDLSSDSD